MNTKNKLVILELISGLLGWVWIIASIVALYFFASALFFDGSWSNFLWAFGIGAVCKWLCRGLIDSKARVAFEAEMVNQGMTKEEAGRAWIKEYMK